MASRLQSDLTRRPGHHNEDLYYKTLRIFVEQLNPTTAWQISMICEGTKNVLKLQFARNDRVVMMTVAVHVAFRFVRSLWWLLCEM